MSRVEAASRQLEAMLSSKSAAVHSTVSPNPKTKDPHSEVRTNFYKSLRYLNSVIYANVGGTTLDLAMAEVRRTLDAARTARNPSCITLKIAYETALFEAGLYDSVTGLGKKPVE